MNDTLKRLIELAREWKDFSKATNGWCTMEYLDFKVRCYFADNSNRTSVSFVIKKWSFMEDKIEVSFHSTPTFGGFTERSIDFVDDAIVEYTELLEGLRSEQDNLSVVEVNRHKEMKIESLERQIESLKGDKP